MSGNTTRLNMFIAEDGDQALIETAVGDNLVILDKAVGSEVFAASALPASGFSGKTVYDTTWKRQRVQQGTLTGWRDISVPVASSLSSIVPTHQGEVAFQTSDNTLKYSSAASAWTTVAPPASAITGQGAIYERQATQSTANNTDVIVDFDTSVKTTAYITKTTSTGSLFTINVTGWYQMSAQAYWAVNSVGRRDVHIINGANSNIRYATSRVPATQNGATGSNATGTPNASMGWYFTAGDTVRVMTNQNSGGSLNLEAQTFGPVTRISFVYMGG